MSIQLAILFSTLAAIAAIALAVAVLARDWKTFAHRILALALVALALEQVFHLLGTQTVVLEEVRFYSQLSLLCAAVVPGLLLWFLQGFGKSDDQSDTPVHWLSLAVLCIPLALVLLFWNSLFTGHPVLQPMAGTLLRLGQAGYAFYLLFILASTLVLAGLERTFRSSVGQNRWQIKFLLLGLGGLLGARIYTSSQSLLYSSVGTDGQVIEALALLVAVALMAVSLRRAKVLKVGLYPSRTLLTRSILVALVGFYLLFTGVLVKLIGYLGWDQSLPLNVLLIFGALVVLAIVLLSDRFQHTVRLFASRHLKRPNYDYRQVWTQFAARTGSAAGVAELASKVARFVSETFQILLVTIWLVPDGDGRLVPVATTRSNPEALKDSVSIKSCRSAVRGLQKLSKTLDLETGPSMWPNEQRSQILECLDSEDIRYLVPLWCQEKFLGVMTLGPAVRFRALTVEDLDLLQVITNQSAADLLNLQLSERLQQAHQLEAFQQMSAFFVHDLKNLASRLSLTLQNLPLHFDNPEFRQDALGTISQSVDKIRGLTSRLSKIREKIELKCSFVDLNQLLKSLILELRGDLDCPIVESFDSSLPETRLDVKQIQTVVTNLLLNASEASSSGDSIEVRTQTSNGSVILTVEDHGEGMDPEFVQNRLFHPFESTKKDGIGIGLFHSKMIVEAHRGRIEVESQPGQGSIFRIVLPTQT